MATAIGPNGRGASLTVDSGGRLLTRLGASDWEYVAAGSNNQPLGPTGAAGDYVERLVCIVSTSATSQVQLRDAGGAQMVVLPANTPIGVHTVPLGIVSVTGDWRLTAAAGVAVLAVGDFT